MINIFAMKNQNRGGGIVGIFLMIINTQYQICNNFSTVPSHHVIARNEAIACYTGRLSRANAFLRAIAAHALAMTNH